jgi:phospholipid/cholesterol/gamma-HCH transport system substrate-binding protein
MYAPDNTQSYIRVGVFVIFSIVVLMLTIYILGQERNYFERPIYVSTKFTNVSGLKSGSTVRLAGLDVGLVSRVLFPEENDSDQRMTVEMRLRKGVLERVRKDSLARIDSMGLLGDKIIDISIGSPQQPQLEDGDWLPSEDGTGFNEIVASAKKTIDNLVEGTDDLKDVLKSFSDAGGGEAIAELSKSITGMLDAVQNGEGLLHQLLYAKSGQQDYEKLMSGVHVAIDSAGSIMTRIDKLLDGVEQSDSFAHEILLGQSGPQTVKDLRELIHSISSVVRSVEENKGSLLHTLLYDNTAGQSIGNITQSTEDLKELIASLKSTVQQIEKGEGTIGALIQDPTVYEDLKLLLGNVRRNQAIRALVRFAVAKEEKEISVKDPS